MAQQDLEKAVENKLFAYVARIASIVAVGFLAWISAQVVEIKGDTQEFLATVHGLENSTTTLRLG